MKSFYAIVLLAFVGLVILGCTDATDQVVAPIEKVSTVSLEKGVIHSATGNLSLEMPHAEPYRVHIEFNAIEHSDGSISGNMRVFDQEAGFWINGEVIDLKVDNGNRAKLSCKIKKNQLEPYTHLFFVVVDNGQGNGSLPDQASWIYAKGDTPNFPGEPSIEEFIAMNSDEFLELFDGWLFEYLNGNVQVR
jgi:hypothetical protein